MTPPGDLLASGGRLQSPEPSVVQGSSQHTPRGEGAAAQVAAAISNAADTADDADATEGTFPGPAAAPLPRACLSAEDQQGEKQQPPRLPAGLVAPQVEAADDAGEQGDSPEEIDQGEDDGGFPHLGALSCAHTITCANSNLDVCCQMC